MCKLLCIGCLDCRRERERERDCSFRDDTNNSLEGCDIDACEVQKGGWLRSCIGMGVAAACFHRSRRFCYALHFQARAAGFLFWSRTDCFGNNQPSDQRLCARVAPVYLKLWRCAIPMVGLPVILNTCVSSQSIALCCLYSSCILLMSSGKLSPRCCRGRLLSLWCILGFT